MKERELIEFIEYLKWLEQDEEFRNIVKDFKMEEDNYEEYSDLTERED